MLPIIGLQLFVLQTSLGLNASPARALFPQYLTVSTFGHPALPSIVSAAAEGAVETKLQAPEGASWTHDPISAPQLLPGQSTIIPVKVRIQTPDHPTEAGKVFVTVRNEEIDFGTESVLWFDNKPENITREATLYSSRLHAGNPVRLLYHHTCRSTQPMVMRAELRNRSDQPARVAIISGDAKPNKEPVLAGASAAAGYLPALDSHSGEIIDIPPKSMRVVAFRKMVLGEVMSGLCSMKLLDGGPDQVEFLGQAEIRRPYSRDLELALLSKTPYDEVGPRPIPLELLSEPNSKPLRYLLPNIEDDVTVTVGSRSEMREFGVEGIPQEGGGRALNGNYGVVYHYAVTAKNPSKFEAKVSLRMTSQTPYTIGVFLVDGRPVILKPLHKGQSREVFRWTVGAGTERNISVLTVPVSGAAYPNQLRFSMELSH